MIGTLLDDIKNGLDYLSISKRFADKMHPLKYQRPQSAPSEGNIKQAEEIIKKINAGGALERRFATLDEIKTIWVPKTIKAPKVENIGVFDHLKTDKNKIKPVAMPVVNITWVKFLKTVLPYADKISYKISHKNDDFTAILTAKNEEAPPILQWDSEEQRNPFSWYLYNNGSHCEKWALIPGFDREITGICYNPAMWYPCNKHSNQPKSVIFIIKGAVDTGFDTCGNALFPHILKSEFHGIRKTIEAYSKKALIHGFDNGSACGVLFNGSDSGNIKTELKAKSFKVDIEGITYNYKIDRWD